MQSDHTRAAEELLVRMGEFGAFVSRRLSEVVGDELLVSNIAIVVLCRLDLEGPLRPNEIAELEDMTTGGVSKLLDRLESDGLVERRRGEVDADQRAVLVMITRKGRSLARKMGDVVADSLGDAAGFFEALGRAVASAEAGG
jgi:DNA-binding MarR family transcriptional regulator